MQFPIVGPRSLSPPSRKAGSSPREEQEELSSLVSGQSRRDKRSWPGLALLWALPPALLPTASPRDGSVSMGDMGSLAWSGLWPQACSRGTFLRWDIYITGKITSLLHSFTSSLDHGPRHCLRDAWSESRAGPVSGLCSPEAHVQPLMTQPVSICDCFSSPSRVTKPTGWQSTFSK